MARAMGVHATRVEDPADLAPALRETFAHPGPALVDAVTNRAELAMPPKITLKEMGDFSLWAAKAVMNGRGNELIDLEYQHVVRILPVAPQRLVISLAEVVLEAWSFSNGEAQLAR